MTPPQLSKIIAIITGIVRIKPSHAVFEADGFAFVEHVAEIRFGDEVAVSAVERKAVEAAVGGRGVEGNSMWDTEGAI